MPEFVVQWTERRIYEEIMEAATAIEAGAIADTSGWSPGSLVFDEVTNIEVDPVAWEKGSPARSPATGQPLPPVSPATGKPTKDRP